MNWLDKIVAEIFSSMVFILIISILVNKLGLVFLKEYIHFFDPSVDIMIIISMILSAIGGAIFGLLSEKSTF